MILRARSAQAREIDQTDYRSWSSAVVPVDPSPPELATNEEWRAIMVRARKDQDLTQKELGARVGTSQNIISLIESGEVSSSQYVMPICRVLKIPPPMHFSDDEQKAWSQLGHLLRTKNMKQFRRAMAMIEAMVEDEQDAEKPANDEAPRPTSRK